MIRGKSIYLRPVEQNDLPRLVELQNDMYHNGEFWPPFLTTEQDLKKRFEESALWDKKEGMLLICDMADDRPVGHLGFFPTVFYMDHAEVGGYIYRREDRSRGFMSEALRLFSAYLFATKPIGRLQASIIVGNTPSRRMAEKCGFRHEGVMRKVVVHNGKRMDMDLLSLLREECMPLNDLLEELRQQRED